MSNQYLKLRRSSVPGKVPTTSSIDLGEIALNTNDGLAYMKTTGSYGERVIAIGSTGSLYGTASWATNSLTASYSPNYVQNSTFNSFTSSYNTGSFTGSFVGSLSGTSSWSQNSLTASYYAGVPSTASWAINALTASSADDLVVRGTLTAQTIVAQTITASTEYVTGSTRFGSSMSNTHQFTGSVYITGSLTSPNITGSLHGTSSWSVNSATASYAPNYVLNSATQSMLSPYVLNSSTSSATVLSSSYAQTASYAPNYVLNTAFNSFTSSYNTGSFTGSFVGSLSGTSSWSQNSLTASYYAGVPATSSWATNAISSSYPLHVTGSSIYARISNLGNISPSESVYIGYQSGQSASGSYYSSFIGSNAGLGATSAYSAVFIGRQAGQNATDAYNSVFLGNNAGAGSSGAYSSIMIGALSGLSATSGYSSVFIGQNSGRTATNANTSVFVGDGSGWAATNASFSTFIGGSSGNNATNAIRATFLGYAAGNGAAEAPYGVFAGYFAGQNAYSASSAVIIGNSAGFGAEKANNATIVGAFAGQYAVSASYSVVLGHRAGYYINSAAGVLGIKSNNIIIGTNITLANGTSDGINIGGILFGTGSYSTTSGDPYSGSVNGKLGVNQPNPRYSFDVSGSGNYSNGLTVTGSLIALSITGSLLGTSSYSSTASYVTASGVYGPYGSNSVLSSSYALTASYALNAAVASIDSSSFATTGSNTFKGNQIISGSVILPQLTSQINKYVVSYDTASGQLYYQVTSSGGGGTATPGGSTGQIQYNNAGAFDGVPSLVYASGQLAATGSFSGSFSGSLFGTSSWANNVVTSSHSTTASYVNPLRQTVTITGSLNITGSTTQVGNNTLLGNTILSGSINMSGSTTQVGNNTLLGNTIISGSFTVSGSFPIGSQSASMNIHGNTTHDGYIRFNPVNTNLNNSVSASYIYVSGSTNDLYFTQNGEGFSNTTRLRWLEGNLYTGLLNGGLISTASSTTFNVSSGSGIIVTLNGSLTTNPYPTIQYVNWGNLNGQALTYRTTAIQTFIGIDSNGSIIQQTSPWYDGQYNTSISLGTVIHQNLSTINATITYPNVAYGYKQRTYDFIKAFGPLRLSGLQVQTSSSLGLTVTSGTAWADGRNYQNDPSNPSYITDSGTAVSKIFRYYASASTFVQDTNGGAGYTVIDPNNYNLNGTGVLTTVGGNYSIQRVFWYPNSATKGIVVYYGNATYATIRDAIDNMSTEVFYETANTQQNAVYIGSIIIKGSADFTSTSNYQIVPAGLFRSIGGTGGGGTVPTSRLSDLADVTITSPTELQALVYDSVLLKWKNASSISASISGNAATATLAISANTASYAPSYVLNSSTSSMTVLSSSYATTASYALNAGTTVNTGSFATTGSNTFKGNQIISGSVILPQLTSQVNKYIVSYDTASGQLYYQVTSSAGGGGGTPGGSAGQIQYNNAGAFDGVPALTYVGGQLSITGSLQGTSSWAENSLTASYAKDFTVSGSMNFQYNPVGNASNLMYYSSSIPLVTVYNPTAHPADRQKHLYIFGAHYNPSLLNNDYSNIVIGGNSLVSASMGRNVVVGTSVMKLAESVQSNVAVGIWTGEYFKTGQKNVFIGEDAGGAMVTGSFNTYLGAQAGYGNNNLVNSQSFNIAIGYRALYHATTPPQVINTTVIGTQLTTTMNNVVLLGRSDQNVILGALTTDNGARLQVSGAISASAAITAPSFTGSLYGTSSWATNTLTASYADNFTVAGTLTAQTIVVQTITASTEYVTGSTRFGSLQSNTHQFTGSVEVTGSLRINGSGTTANFGTNGYVGLGTTVPLTQLHLVYPGSTSALATSYINGITLTGTENNGFSSGPGLYFENTSADAGERVFKFNHRANAGGTSYLSFTSVTDDAIGGVANDILTIDHTGIVTAPVLKASNITLSSTSYHTAIDIVIEVGSPSLLTIQTGSYTAGFFEYTINSGSNARAGVLMTVWNGDSIQYTDNSTFDIGNTSNVTMSAEIVGGTLSILGTSTVSDWSGKINYRLI